MNKKCICDVKEGEEKEISKGQWVDLYITLNDDEYRIEAVADGRASMYINYCPMCGRNLEG